jgi:hypothetical protein
MRKYLLSAAAALAIATPAAAETSGYVDASYESSEYSLGDEYDILNLGGGVHHEFDNGWGVQADARTGLQSFDGASQDEGVGYAAVHAYFGINDHWDLGGYAGLISESGDGHSMFGLESRKHIGNLSLQGSASFAHNESWYDASDYRLSANWFFAPNFAVNAGVGWTEWDWESGFDAEATDWSLGGAYQFAGGLVLHGSYASSDTDWVTYTYDVETFRIGVRWNFNGGDLQTVANEGASWSAAATFQDQLTRLDN